MDRDRVFEGIFGHCVHQSARIEQALECLLEEVGDAWRRLIKSIAASFTTNSVALYASIAQRYKLQPPNASLRHAPKDYDLLDNHMREAITSMAYQGMIRWRSFLIVWDLIGNDSQSLQDDENYVTAENAFELLLGFDCLMSGTDPLAKTATLDDLTSRALDTLMDEDEQVREREVDERQQAYIAQFSEDLHSLAEAVWLHENTVAEERIFVPIDLRAMKDPLVSWLIEEKVKRWVSTLAISDHPQRYSLLAKAIIGTAGELLSWRPPNCEERRISDAPPSDAIVRRCARVIAMVHELHKAGYQRLRILPFVSGSGCYWRGWITDSDNICGDGFSLIDWDDEDRTGRVAKYTSGHENSYFGWTDAKGLSARALASLFLERFPKIAAKGRGCDWAYAGWLTDLLGHAEQGELISLMQEGLSNPDTLRRWQPPPPIRPLS
jgi:hypothetical protein